MHFILMKYIFGQSSPKILIKKQPLFFLILLFMLYPILFCNISKNKPKYYPYLKHLQPQNSIFIFKLAYSLYLEMMVLHFHFQFQLIISKFIFKSLFIYQNIIYIKKRNVSYLVVHISIFISKFTFSLFFLE